MNNQPGKTNKTEFELGVGTTEKLRIYMLGGFQVTWGSKEIQPEQIRLRRARDLVKLLALAPDHLLQHEQVLEWLWPDQDPAKSAHSLNQLLYQLRPILSSLHSTLTIRREMETLVLTSSTGIWTDVAAFVGVARNLQINPDPAECQSALMLYRGDLLPDDPYSDLFERRREELRELRFSLLRQLATYHTNHQEYPQAIELLHQLVEADPANEESQVMLIRAFRYYGERQSALNQYHKMAEILHRELGAAPSEESQRLYNQLVNEKAGATYPALANHLLPVELTSFIGREAEVDQVCRLVTANRLVTLTGSGGVGKTRLGLKVAERLAPDFPDGVFWVELAPVVNDTMLIAAITGALGIRGSSGENQIDLLQERLRDRPSLLILDNAEHILSACAQLTKALIKGSLRLHVLVTSRAPLALPGECIYRVPKMRLPEPCKRLDMEQVKQCEAVRLFIERAREKNYQFAVTAENIGAITNICQQLDGIPLAIELAAARVRMLTIEQIAAKLDDVFNLLTSSEYGSLPRHRTLKAVIEWSYKLIGEKERLLLHRLSVFSGCWSLEAAETIAAGDGLESAEVLELLGQLIDQSFVSLEFQIHGEGYYRMLETVRQYARGRLLETGSETALRDRHLSYFTHLADQADTLRVTTKEVNLTDHFFANLGNLRAALDWSLNGQVTLGMRLSTDLYWFWFSRGLGLEAITWWLKLLEVEETTRDSLILAGERKIQRARVLRSITQMTIYFNHPDLQMDQKITNTEESIRLLSEEPGTRGRHELAKAMLYGAHTSQFSRADLQMKALEIFRAEEDRIGSSQALLNASICYFCNGEFDASLHLAEEALRLALQAQDFNGIGISYNMIGECEIIEGNYQKADYCYEESLRYTRLAKDRWSEYNLYDRTLVLRVAEGKYEQAFVVGQSALAMVREFQDRYRMSWTTSHLARCAWSCGDYSLARNYCQEAMALTRQTIKDPVILIDPVFLLGRIALTQTDLVQATEYLRMALIKIQNCKQIPFVLLVDTIGILCHLKGQPDRAAVLFGFAELPYRKVMHYICPRDRSEHEANFQQARTSMGVALFDQAFQRGSLLSWEEAAAFAFECLEKAG